jgi:hypothetical protein
MAYPIIEESHHAICVHAFTSILDDHQLSRYRGMNTDPHKLEVLEIAYDLLGVCGCAFFKGFYTLCG